MLASFAIVDYCKDVNYLVRIKDTHVSLLYPGTDLGHQSSLQFSGAGPDS